MKTPIAIVLLLFAFSVSAQVDDRETFDMDVSFIAGLSLKKHRNPADYRLGLQFRKRINKTLIFKASAVYNDVATRHYKVQNLPVFLSDSVQILRSYGLSASKQYLLRSGIDFDFSKYILLGANLIIGYSPVSTYYSDYGLSSNDQGATWRGCASCTWEYNGQDVPVVNPLVSSLPYYGERISESTYLIYGTSINLGLQMPLLKRFVLGVEYEPQILRYHHKQDAGSSFVDAFESFTSVKHFTDAFVRVAF